MNRWFVIAGLVLVACSSDGETEEPLRTFAAANTYPADHPLAKGQYHFLYDSFGTEQLDKYPPAAFMLNLMKSEPDVFGNQFEKFGFIADPNDEFPVGFKRGLVDATKVGETCAVCHVSRLPDGRLWLGAPNSTLDIGRFKDEVNKRWIAAGNPSRYSEVALEKFRGLGPGRSNAESNEYPKLVAADFPPYFRLRDRSHLNYLGTGGNLRSEASLSIFTFGAGDPEAKVKIPFPEDAVANAFVDFLGSIEPPKGPEQPKELVDAGKQTFERAGCIGCHHPDEHGFNAITTFDETPNGKELMVGVDPAFPRGTIRTDARHRLLVNDPAAGGDGGYDTLLQFIVTKRLIARATDGYRALDLSGLWATAPYLHNGSVPTLEALFEPVAQRPAKWDHHGFAFDTSVPADGNEGHEFGTDLPAEEKSALIAYLKSL